jgi:formylglycine-generating enzyme required for sulfatase activity
MGRHCFAATVPLSTQELPATWSQTASGRIVVHSAAGSRPWKEVRDAPVLCSLAEAQAFCTWRGGGARVMTEAEYQRIVDVRADNK